MILQQVPHNGDGLLRQWHDIGRNGLPRPAQLHLQLLDDDGRNAMGTSQAASVVIAEADVLHAAHFPRGSFLVPFL